MDDSRSVDDSQTTEDSITVDYSLECNDSGWYPASFMERLQEFRSEGHLVDVTLCAEEKELPCHRLVLSACSDYFHAMFNGAHPESKKDKIEIGGVSAEALQLLVDFAYTSKITITTDNVQPLYEAANMLQVKPVEDGCEDFLTDGLSPETCLVTWALADRVSNAYLSANARSFALKFFEEVCATEEFLELPVDFMKSYFADDDLHAEKEKQVIEAVLLWVRYDLEGRQTHLKDLLECVRFSHVDQDYLKNILETDKELAGVSGIKELIRDQSVQARSCQNFQGEILILGGLKVDYKPNFLMDRLDVHCNCVDTTPLPPSLCDIVMGPTAACVVNNDVIVTVGRKEVWRYKSSHNSWTELGSLRTERYRPGMAVLQRKVYVVGGVISELIIEETEVYNELTDSWELVAPLRQAVSSFGITSCCEKIYVLGGRFMITYYEESRAKTDVVQCYSPTLNAWTFATPLPESMSHIEACTINSKIYLVGGLLASVLCYDPQQDCYEEMIKPLFPWGSGGATVCGSEIFITGGYVRNDVSCDDHEEKDNLYSSYGVQCYNANSNTMIRLHDLPIALSGHISVTIPKL
ncbi:kelch-like protein 24 [Branchiostoma lanceolatum]|uniref:kelch-like protein 24 n=1 Tax=Branchiostoma lanceolatum TaxID=7740 RepID=UPI0034549E7C